MRAIDFLVWLRDEMFCCPQTTEGSGLGLPSNGELRRWLKKGVVKTNEKVLSLDSEIEFPITNLVFFHNSKVKRPSVNQLCLCHVPKRLSFNRRCTIV